MIGAMLRQSGQEVKFHAINPLSTAPSQHTATGNSSEQEKKGTSRKKNPLCISVMIPRGSGQEKRETETAQSDSEPANAVVYPLDLMEPLEKMKVFFFQCSCKQAHYWAYLDTSFLLQARGYCQGKEAA